jgi:hypothetical protein
MMALTHVVDSLVAQGGSLEDLEVREMDEDHQVLLHGPHHFIFFHSFVVAVQSPDISLKVLVVVGVDNLRALWCGCSNLFCWRGVFVCDFKTKRYHLIYFRLKL